MIFQNPTAIIFAIGCKDHVMKDNDISLPIILVPFKASISLKLLLEMTVNLKPHDKKICIILSRNVNRIATHKLVINTGRGLPIPENVDSISMKKMYVQKVTLTLRRVN